MTFTTVLFYILAAVLVIAAFRVITARSPVTAVLHLILAFVNAAMLWTVSYTHLDVYKRQIMASLAIAQEEKGWLATDIIEDVANYIGVPPIAVQEVATFYNMFDVKPVGKTKIAVCTNLPCACLLYTSRCV